MKSILWRSCFDYFCNNQWDYEFPYIKVDTVSLSTHFYRDVTRMMIGGRFGEDDKEGNQEFIGKWNNVSSTGSRPKEQEATAYYRVNAGTAARTLLFKGNNAIAAYFIRKIVTIISLTRKWALSASNIRNNNIGVRAWWLQAMNISYWYLLPQSVA